MRARIIGVAALVAAALAVIAATASGGAAATNSITVWLQVDAQAANWEPIVKAANAAFQREHPGVAVNVQYQTWGNHLQKFDATLAGGNAPDVIEMGNTETTKYMAAGAFQDITSDRSSFANSATWLDGLAAAGRYSGKVYGVPYYAGSRVVTYRTDLFKKANIKVPTSLAQFTAAARKLGRQQGDRALLAGLHRRHRLVLRDELRLRQRRHDRTAGQRQVEGHARLAEGDRRPHRVPELLPRRLAGEQDDGRDEAEPVRRLRTGECRLDGRAGLVQLLRRRQVQAPHGAVRDAEQDEGPADAGLPRRLDPRRSRSARTRRSPSTGSRPTRATSR